jgi:RNA polymerase sigma factor (sigma-70 family)
MANTGSEFERLMERVRSGCPEAAQELLDRFGEYVRLVVRRRLDDRLRRIYESGDFAQSVWADFFQAPGQGRTFTSPDQLGAFLAKVATNKVIDAHRQRLGTLKHDLARERSLEEDLPQAPGANLGKALPARTPTPSQQAIAAETAERLVKRAPANYRQAIEMLRQGYCHREVAKTLDLHPKMLQRILRQLRSKVLP